MLASWVRESDGDGVAGLRSRPPASQVTVAPAAAPPPTPNQEELWLVGVGGGGRTGSTCGQTLGSQEPVPPNGVAFQQQSSPGTRHHETLVTKLEASPLVRTHTHVHTRVLNMVIFTRFW